MSDNMGRCRCGAKVSYRDKSCPSCGLLFSCHGPGKPNAKDFHGWDLLPSEELEGIEEQFSKDALNIFKEAFENYTPLWLNERLALAIQNVIDKEGVLAIDACGLERPHLVFGLCKQGIEDDGQWTKRFDLSDLFKRFRPYDEEERSKVVEALKECLSAVESSITHV